MTRTDPLGPEQGLPETPVRPESVVQRQEQVSGYLLRRYRRRRARFLKRAAAFSLRKEFARNAFLAGCILFDGLVVPEPIFLWPGLWGWLVAGAAFVVSLWAEARVYVRLFSLPDSSGTPESSL